MTAASSALDALRAARDELTTAVAALPDRALAHDGLAESLLEAAAEELRERLAIAHALEAAAVRPPPAVRRLRSAVTARRRVEASLCGLSAAQLDRVPARDEWSVRRIVEHLMANDRRYLIQAAHAATREDGTPLRPDPSLLPDRAPETVPGESIAALIARLRGTQHASIAPLFGLDEGQLRRPTDWAGSQQTVAFRLDRFGQHHDEHAVDIAHALELLGFARSRAVRLAAARIAQLGELEADLLGLPSGFEDARGPGDDDTIGGRLARLGERERSLLVTARKASA